MDKDQTIKSQSDDQSDQRAIPQPQPPTGLGLGEKEREASGAKEMVIEAVGKEIEPEKEVKEAGVGVKKDEVELPPPVEKMGVKPSGASAPLPPLPTVTLPLTDDQVVQGLASSLVSSLRWLAEFCLRQLKKAHIGLKKVHGKIVRVKR